ncbi:MAG: hypothetical protein A2091_13360 [Desulfuromonadales bacterium GWD2_61_12]|nr:MAG: hypothetical protein A2005_11970 [Desulfuromonadales bacterium GWC2_61_20]OGR35576.1 MAG: hypothetical protein A2091_13360 [Desulfuromonadales bacterium GWD2_61_12]HAD03334.1 hypothetical protein [Desulfuromonas sp.]HBT82783.1 hypothetical protein [Desulfuromonas sp.]
MATLLLVDDVDLFLALETSLLDGTGHRLVTASSGEAAWAMLDDVVPDLVLTDLFMPGMDGDELCRRLRAAERWRELPVIMVTAAGKEEQIRQCLAAGCDDYVTKPINKTDLLEKVNRLLGHVHGRTARRTQTALRVLVRGEGKEQIAKALDLSSNGIFVKSPLLLDEGAAVELALSLPDGVEVQMLGKVARIKQAPDQGMGIYLIHPQGRGLRAIQELMRATEEDEGPMFELVLEEGDGATLGRGERANSARAGELDALRQRVLELEEENLTFARQVIHTEEVNNNLTNLYIASSRLHSVLNRGEVLEIIREVIINFVGAEKFAVLLFHKTTGELHFEVGEGFEPGEFPPFRPESGIFAEVAASESAYFQEGSVAQGSDDPLQPIAAVPLKIHDTTMGILAIYRLFIQKEAFQPVDFQLFSMMAEHAVTALFSSTLYEQSERKRETYKGVMDLLLK